MLILVSCGSLLPFHYVNSGEGPATPSKVIPVWIDEDFGNADQIAINDAIDQWNYALNGYIKLIVVSTHFNMENDVLQQVNRGDGWLILRITARSYYVVDDTAHGHMTLAFANKIGGNQIYVVRDRIPNEWMTGLLLHEIGHLLGAQHDEKDLMKPVYDLEDGRCIDADTLRQVAAYQHLRLDKLSYCVYTNP